MRSAGLSKVTYRLRTELGIEAWHWSEQGTWSDPGNEQGYWTSSYGSDQRVLISHGYRLPRRGNTIDQAENDGYSRLDDGDDSTFWKSNPYLDKRYTGDANDQRPQWVVVDLGEPRPVNAVSIHWGVPYATHFEIQYGTNIYHYPEVRSSTDPGNVGKWQTFPQGSVSGGTGERALLRLSGSPLQARYIRILLYDSSGKGPPGSIDIRDSLGFAIREVSLGVIDDAGTLQDEITHAADNKAQTVTYTSSTDPWHRAIDIDPNTEQPGFDLVFNSGLTNGLPVLVPVPLLYDTPENAAAEIRFLKTRGYDIRQVEMGEEPDGQQVSPEHEAALYVEFATAIHSVDSTLALGGLSFQSGIVRTRFDGEQNESWVSRFLAYLRDRRRLEDYSFLSFEWYPFDDLCQRPSEQLIRQPKLLADVFQKFREQGVPTTIPWIISEYGFSAFAGRTMVEMPGALLNADIVGQSLMLGGKAAYLYGYEPSTPINERSRCAGYGQMMFYEADERGQAIWPMPSYFAARLLSREWIQPGNKAHRVYPTSSDMRDGSGRPIVTAYAVQRPDDSLSIMLVNKDSIRDYSVRINFVDSKSVRKFVGRVAIYQYSRQQYVWKASGTKGHPLRTEAPHRFKLGGEDPVRLPAFSLTIVQGKLAAGSLGHHTSMSFEGSTEPNE
jgi:F5/8 type C domain